MKTAATLALALAGFVLGANPSPVPSPVVQRPVVGVGYLSSYNDGGNTTLSLDAGGTLVTATSADLNLFVDPTGNDSNACTDGGTSACLTIGGAYNKVPKSVRHLATIALAAGSFAGVTVSGSLGDPGASGTSYGIALVGTLANVAPASGSATGTASSGTAGSGSTFGTLTDSTQSWTINDPALVGKFVSITGGTGAGQLKTIVSNTATVLTIAGTWTAPTGTSAYALQAPASIITSSVPSILDASGAIALPLAGIQIYKNTVPVLVKNIAISLSGGSRGIASDSPGVVITQTTISTVSTPIFLQSGSATISTVAANGTNDAIITAANVTVSNSRMATVSSGSNCLTTSSIGLGGAPLATVTGSYLGCAHGLVIQGTGYGSFASSRCACVTTGDSACLVVGAFQSINNPFYGPRSIVNGNVDIGTNCNYGLDASGPGASLVVSAGTVISGNALTAGGLANYGASIVLPSNVTTATSIGSEMSLDNGAATGTWAALSASFNCLVNLSTGSRICRL